jgi:hypothetical protein
MTFFIGEIFDNLKTKTRAEKITYLRSVAENQPAANKAFATWLQVAYHPDIIFDLPPGVPPYKKNDAPLGYADASLYQGTRKLGLWLRPNSALALLPVAVTVNPALKPSVRERAFIDFLQAIPAVDAEFLLAAKEKTLEKIYGVGDDVIREAFPNLQIGLVVSSFSPVPNGPNGLTHPNGGKPKAPRKRKRKSRSKKAAASTSAVGSNEPLTSA